MREKQTYRHVSNLCFAIVFAFLFGACESMDFNLLKWGSKSKQEQQKEGQTEKPWVEEKSKPLTVPWKGQAIGASTFIEIARKADPGVVNIGTTQVIKRRRPRLFERPDGGGDSPFDDFFGGDLFRHFFGEGEEQPEIKRPSLGSGFILNEEGYIVTNNHVVEKASEITVTIGLDKEYEAKLVGADPKTDVALIKIDAKEKLQPLVLGDSDALQVGEIVVAIGNPFGLSHTVTQGIVSAKERTIGFGPYDNFIQTDASINPGNSGGPLLNLEAKVIGINTAIVASGQGIGFAIPINLAKNIITQLKDNGSVTRGWLGVYIQKVDPDLAKSLGLKEKRGALVSSVQKGSPADDAGIQSRDVILEVEGKAIKDYSELPRLVASMKVGQKITIKIKRDGKDMTVTPVIGKLKADEAETKAQAQEEKQSSNKPDKLGFMVETLSKSEAERRELDYAEKRGVIVTKVDPSSKAAEKISRGDIILEVNKTRVRNLSEYSKVLESIQKNDSVLLLVERPNAGSLYIAFTL